jgi:trimethylamine-N-oxide reductase (cytochrome c)
MSQDKDNLVIDPSATITHFKSLSLAGLDRGGAPCAVDVNRGKIVRIRPLHYDWKFEKKQFNLWKIEKNGKTFELEMKSLPSPFSLAYKKRAYSPNRIKYPIMRIDWDPNGERHPENRGKSKYKRISWDEATEIIAKEIKRIKKQYGPYAILAQADGHGENKTIHAPHGYQTLLLEKLGGFTQQVRNPDSWEGWYWGAKHVWGQGSVGLMDPSANVVRDIIDHTEMVLFWGCDPETTPWGFAGQFASKLCFFWGDIGIKQVYICPDLNYGAAVHADKWIPILPNTDVALQLAIAHTWISEGTYEKDYVATHTVGFDRFADYVLGKKDGVAKTPEWASKKCGVPEWTIKALAREFAVKVTSTAHFYGGSYIRGPYSHEPARLECILLGMQGLGKPGVHQSQLTHRGLPRSMGLQKRIIFNDEFSKRLQRPIQATQVLAPTKQYLPKTLIYRGINNPPVSFMGAGAINSETEDQFKKYVFPIPEEEDGSEIRMIWTDTPCLTTCWNCGNETIEAYRNPKVEFIVAQHPWLENDCLFADIILPANTTFEVEDIVTSVREMQCVTLQHKSIEPVGESKSDFEIVSEVAKKLGLYEEDLENKISEDLEKLVFDGAGMQKYISWEEFKEKCYFCFPTAEDWEKDPPGFRLFYEDPEKNPLPTPSGKLEFYSERLAKHFPDDKERPPIPMWIEKSETHDERLSSERAKEYPLLVMSNHGRWRVHAQCDDISWTREAPTCKVMGPDGYKYEPCWLHPGTAAARGIKNGDIVKVFNEKGIVLGGAYVTERLMPGVVYMDHGARVDYIIPGKVDRGGAINLISPSGTTSKNSVGQATSSYLVEVDKVTLAQMEEWKNQYPEAFEREYDPASGLRFNAWIEGGM